MFAVVAVADDGPLMGLYIDLCHQKVGMIPHHNPVVAESHTVAADLTYLYAIETFRSEMQTQYRRAPMFCKAEMQTQYRRAPMFCKIFRMFGACVKLDTNLLQI